MSWLIDHYYRWRRFSYDYGIITQNSFQVPIISVGNLTHGGTGKTPITMWIAEYVTQSQKQVMILMRGYRGKLENSHGYIRSNTKMNPDPLKYGDEAVLYAKKLKNVSVTVGKKRAINLNYYFPEEKPDLVILDDGHQHLMIKRNLNIVLFDLMAPLGKYRVFPLGDMRENFHSLNDTDVVVLTRADMVDEFTKQEFKKILRPFITPKTLLVEAYYKINGLFDLNSNLKVSKENMKNKSMIILTAIGSPNAFVKSIEDLGGVIIKKYIYPDHYYFKIEELRKIVEEAKAQGALIVSTEKDIVKIKQVIEHERFFYLDISVGFLKGEDEFKTLIQQVLH